jgi:hypothetical protein
MQISQNYQGTELFFKGKTGELSSCPVDHGTVPVHGGLVAVASREARRHCRVQELTAGGKKREGTSVILTGCTNRQ